MLIHKTRFEKLLSFLQGASWALALAGGFYLFLAFLPFGFVVASILGVILFLFGAFFAIMFQLAQVQIDKYEEMKKQTLLLEKFTKNDQTISHY